MRDFASASVHFIHQAFAIMTRELPAVKYIKCRATQELIMFIIASDLKIKIQ